MESASNGIVAVLLGVYLAGIVRHGNAEQLLIELANDRGFVLWLVAIVLVAEVISRTGDLGRGLSVILSIGLVLNVGPIVFPQLDQLLKGAQS